MVFTYSCWEAFCKKLSDNQLHSIPAKKLMHESFESPYIVLKHDVETNVASALQIAQIEQRYGHCGSYYVQAYLLSDEKNVAILKEMQHMGHEISYHYDVMDSNHGNIEAAIAEFQEKKRLFEDSGFQIETICQHGNPVVERAGYTSNRDFFRNSKVQKLYPQIADIMVDFKQKAFLSTEYTYFSDAGRQFKLIYDPINNDLIPSDDKNIPFDNLDVLLMYIQKNGMNAVISMHPHRWVKSKTKYIVKTAMFKVIKAVAKLLMKIPLCKKIMSRYFYLAKKI